MKNSITISAFLLLCTPALPAQVLEIGVLAGGSVYSGDLSPKNFGIYPQETLPAFGLFARFHINDYFTARLGYIAARLKSEDFNPKRDLNFQTRINEVSLTGELSWWRFPLNNEEGAIIPHLILGVGYFRFSPEGRQGGDWIPLQPLGTEGQTLPDGTGPYQLRTFNIPVGLGVKFKLNENLVLGIEISGRKLFTDYVDDIGNTRVDYQKLIQGTNALTAKMSYPNLDPTTDREVFYRRGGSYNDWFYVGGVSLGYAFFRNESKSAKNKKNATGCYQF